MQKKQSAIIDFGSSKITAIVGEKGVNGTFLFKGRFEFPYEGYADNIFFDSNELKTILTSISDKILESSNNKINTVYVGVPSHFTEVFVKDSQISFSKKKKISDDDVDSLFEATFVVKSTKRTLINRSAIYYELDDARKVANPVGTTSAILKGKLSFVVCNNYFIEAVKPTLNFVGIENVEFVSTSLCEALYLIEPEVRDRIAVLCDIGHIDTSFTIIQGDGIIYQKSIDFGGGYINAELVNKYKIEFDVAEKLKRKTNLCRESFGAYDVIEMENGSYFPIGEIKDIVISTLDNLCEKISDTLDDCGYTIPEYVSLNITGGGIALLRGAKEHLSNRLNMSVNVVYPKVPMLEKPTESSALSLLDLAVAQI